MNNPAPASGPETELRPLLEAWQVNVPLAPGFKARVWRRLANDATPDGLRLARVLLAWLDGLFARPSWSFGYTLLLLSAGLLTGYWAAGEQTARWDQVMATRYVQSVDPAFQATLQP
jgi:hypothetical protein